jgi:hypothetical protein
MRPLFDRRLSMGELQKAKEVKHYESMGREDDHNALY